MNKKSRGFSYWKNLIIIAVGILIALVATYFLLLNIFAWEYSYSDVSVTGLQKSIDKVIDPGSQDKTLEETLHIEIPKPLKAVYMSACYAGSKNLREGIVQLIDDTELNAVVIDVKDYSGYISFLPDDSWKDYLSDRCNALDLKDFVKHLHDKGIFAIARITVFQDPVYSKRYPETAVKLSSDKSVIWKDYKKISYVDPGSTKFWDHIVALANASYDIGFDEINFDYIRFPSDGNMKDIYFPISEGKYKPAVMEDFFKYLNQKLKPTGAVLSADLFGMVTTNTDDLNIGQQLERALPYFDYIAPMVYPSHYPKNFHGWSNPNDHVYDLIKFVMSSSVERTRATSTVVSTFDGVAIASTTPQLYTKESFDIQKMRPWLQDFDYGGDYGPTEVRAQIQATYDSGLTSWMLWSPSNRYTKEALRSKE